MGGQAPVPVPGGSAYQLVAAVLHKGKSAYGGHYVCQLQDEANGTWYCGRPAARNP